AGAPPAREGGPVREGIPTSGPGPTRATYGQACTVAATAAPVAIRRLVKSRCVSRTFSVRSKYRSTAASASNWAASAGTCAAALLTALVTGSNVLRTASWPCSTKWAYCSVSIVIVCLPGDWCLGYYARRVACQAGGERP